MWLPRPIYEKTPQLWLLMAVLFVVMALYIGLDYALTYFYLLLGIVCAVRGVHVLHLRKIYRRAKRDEAETGGEALPEAAGN